MLKYTGKKSQLEIVGLVIIVVLISLALLFFLQFSLKKGPEIKKTYTTAQMTSNMVNTLVKTSTACDGNTVKTLLVDCAKDYLDEIGYIDCGFGIYSCSFVDNEIRGLLDKTLNSWSKRYQLSAFLLSDPEKDIFYYNNQFERCTGNIESESLPFPAGQGGRETMLVKLDVCVD